jgi:hypothetical protein
MTNNLIFKNGAVFAVCDTAAENAPNMLGGGWRGFHIVGVCANVVSALASGIDRREYESIKGVGEDGAYETETLTEDLSAYTVVGSVVDHMDRTLTVWARQATELEMVEEDLDNVAAVAAKADLTDEHELILKMPTEYCTALVWGTSYLKGRLTAYKGVKYLVMQDVTAAEHQPPDMPNGAMLAIYKPYQGEKGYPWVYGEYCEAGFTRFDGGVLYRAKSDPGANIYPPSAVPAVWEVV